ncbi:MAG: DNA methyltransferase [Gammaproteobacteria bacterium]|nr:DNA methyltransferase [Gammaproteobacteria bacterium]
MSEHNWENRTIWTDDNLPIMRGMNSESIDLIYLDPPFNSNANYAAPIGSEAAGAAFKDTWTLDDVDIAWLDLIEAKHPKLNRVIHAAMSKSDKSYLIYMAVRLLEMKRLLKPTGSIYLHCDPTMSHYLKLMMDAVFGRRNFRNEIVWCYTGPGSPKMKQFNRKHDTIFWYSNSETWTFNADSVRIRHHAKTKGNFKEGLRGSGFIADTYDLAEGGKVPESWWAQEKGNGFAIAARHKNQYVGYPTQKPLALLDRIIKASSNEGDVVFDPFCGCATTCVSAELLTRQWVGIDISPKAAVLVESRLKGNLKGDLGVVNTIVRRTDIPQRNDLGDLPPYNSPKLKNALYGEQGGDCNGCGTHFQKQHLTIDHIIAQSKGGTDHIENLQLLCGHCNSVKGDRGQEYLLAKLAA